MFVPESLKKEAMRAVKRKIEEEIKQHLTVEVNHKYLDHDARELEVVVKYKGEEVTSGRTGFTTR